MDPHHPGGFSSPWAAVLGPHNASSTAQHAAAAAYHHHHQQAVAAAASAHHAAAAMDLHVGQAFPYYR